MKKYFEIMFHLDELNRMMKNKKYKPFVCELGKGYENYSPMLEQGKWIDGWDDSVTFMSCQDGFLDDRLSNDSNAYLFSDKVISVFKESNITGLQYLPVKILTQNKERLAGYSHVGNIYKRVACLNFNESVYSVFGDKDSKYPHPNPEFWGKVRILDKMVINRTALPDDLDIFRLDEKKYKVIVSQRFVDIWRSYKFTNLAFEEILT